MSKRKDQAATSRTRETDDEDLEVVDQNLSETAKKKKKTQQFKSAYVEMYPMLRASRLGETFAFYTWCKKDFSRYHQLNFSNG